MGRWLELLKQSAMKRFGFTKKEADHYAKNNDWMNEYNHGMTPDEALDGWSHDLPKD